MRTLWPRLCSQAEERPRPAWRLFRGGVGVSYLKVTTYAVHLWGGGELSWGGGEILVEDQIDLCFRVVMIASLHDRFWGCGAG